MKIQLAGCVILDDYGRLLLLHRSTDKLSQWELPGGKLEGGETAELAAVRELQEELGITVRLTKALGSGQFADDENEYQFMWFQAIVIGADPMLKETELFDDLDYFDLGDLMGLALSANMVVLYEKILSGEVAIEV